MVVWVVCAQGCAGLIGNHSQTRGPCYRGRGGSSWTDKEALQVGLCLHLRAGNSLYFLKG